MREREHSGIIRSSGCETYDPYLDRELMRDLAKETRAEYRRLDAQIKLLEAAATPKFLSEYPDSFAA